MGSVGSSAIEPSSRSGTSPTRSRVIPATSRNGASSFSAAARGSEVRHGDGREGAAAQRLWKLGERRELVGVEPHRQLARSRPGHLGEGREHLPGPVGGPEQPAAVDLGCGVKVELDARDDAEVATASTERPEQLGVLGRGDRAEPAGAVDQLDGADAVGTQAVGPAEPADPAGDRHADDRGVGVRAGQEGQPGAVEGGEQLARLDTGPHPGGAPVDVDRELGQGAGAQQEHAVERAGGAVARGLGVHLPPVPARPSDGRDHVVGRGHLEHRERVLLDVDDPRGADLVPGRVGRGVQGAGREPAELVERRAAGRGEEGHRRAFRVDAALCSIESDTAVCSTSRARWNG